MSWHCLLVSCALRMLDSIDILNEDADINIFHRHFLFLDVVFLTTANSRFRHHSILDNPSASTMFSQVQHPRLHSTRCFTKTDEPFSNTSSSSPADFVGSTRP
ncbi:hypothetical protein GE09DRAFT_560948 [Coniochaeta sp. 2T2.1]|nr:hypothetical protein GE09DRAFT_560948 [Coniochaeta sp. 2T2.1]